MNREYDSPRIGDDEACGVGARRRDSRVTVEREREKREATQSGRWRMSAVVPRWFGGGRSKVHCPY